MDGERINQAVTRWSMLSNTSLFSETLIPTTMKELKCEVSECQITLNSLPEVGIGLCDHHHSALTDRGNYAIICDTCSCIHAIEPSPLQYGELVFKDKYVFTKSCPQCSEISLGEDWMNKSDALDSSKVILRAGETLHPTRLGLKPGLKRHIKLGPTVTDGHNVFAKVKLSPDEVDQNLSNLFDNLDYGELDHGKPTNPSGS